MTTTKLSTAFLLATALCFMGACDSELDTDVERSAALDADVDDPAAPSELDEPPCSPDERGMKRGKHRMKPGAKLCAMVECSEEQQAQIEGVFEARKAAAHERFEGMDIDREAHKAMRDQAHQSLAEAFRGEDFDPSVLEELHAGAKAKFEGEGRGPEAHVDEAVAMLAELTALLTPEQREQLSKEIAAGELPLPHAPHRSRQRHPENGQHREREHSGFSQDEGGKFDRKAHHEARLAHHVERFCEPLACTEDQQSQLRAAFEGAHEERRAEGKPDFAPLAAALSAEGLDEDAAKAALLALKTKGEGKMERGFGSVAAEVHAILTPEQRAQVADEIAAKGPRAMFGKGGKGHGRKHGPRHGRDHGPRHDGN